MLHFSLSFFFSFFLGGGGGAGGGGDEGTLAVLNKMRNETGKNKQKRGYSETGESGKSRGVSK